MTIENVIDMLPPAIMFLIIKVILFVLLFTMEFTTGSAILLIISILCFDVGMLILFAKVYQLHRG